MDLSHEPTTASICLDRLLCSAVQHARHADDGGDGAGGQFTGRTVAVEQFLHRQRDEDGRDQHRRYRSKSAGQRHAFQHAALLVLLGFCAIGGVAGPFAAAVFRPL